MPSQLPNLQKQVKVLKKLHDAFLNVNYSIPVIVNWQVASSECQNMSARSDRQTDSCVTESSVNSFSKTFSHMKELSSKYR